MRFSRRALVVGGVAAGAAASAALWASRSRPAGENLDRLIDGLIRSSEESVLEWTAQALRRGARLDELLAAAILAPILTGGDVEDVHSVLAIPAIGQVARAAHGEYQLLPAFWGVANALSWSQRERRAFTPPRSASRAADAWKAAFRDRDLDAAEAALSTRLVEQGVGAAMAALRLEGTRQRGDPHGAIYAAQATRALPLIDARYTPAVLRSVARYLARSAAAEQDPEPYRSGPEDNMPPEEIALALSAAPHSSLEGLASSAVWAGLALMAARTPLDPSLISGGTIHQTTLLDALWHCHQLAAPEEKPLILARAVRWVTGFRVEPAPSSEPPHEWSEWLRRPGGEASFLAELRQRVALWSIGEHDFKLFAAVENIASQLPPPARSRWWARMTNSHVARATTGWSRLEEARALIAAL
jgi:hypothetical protein